MPELPEVQTTVNGINKTAKGRKIIDVWTSYDSAYHASKDNIKDPKFFKLFKKKVVGQKILKADRKAKNILIHISGGYTIIVHMKMTGHVLFGKYRKVNPKSETLNPKQIPNIKSKKSKQEIWVPVKEGPLTDPFNAHIRLVFSLDNPSTKLRAGGKHLVLSDMRKFAKVTIARTDELEQCFHLEHLGPEPLEESFKFEAFKSRILKKPKGRIKQVLMNQTLISGIGNIYSDEILWRAGVHPLSRTDKIPEKNLRNMYKAMKETLKQGIALGGDSMSDYRNIKGEKGEFQEHHRAYQKTGEPCSKRACAGVLEKTSIGGRSAHFCPVHQKLFK